MENWRSGTFLSVFSSIFKGFQQFFLFSIQFFLLLFFDILLGSVDKSFFKFWITQENGQKEEEAAEALVLVSFWKLLVKFWHVSDNQYAIWKDRRA